MLRPDANDPLKDRRLLAMLAAFNGFFVFPLFITVISIHFKASDSLCKALLVYMGVDCLAPVLGYLYAAHKKDKDNAGTCV